MKTEEIKTAEFPVWNVDFDALAKKSYEVAKEKGWYESPRADSMALILMISELSEVLEDYRNGFGISDIRFDDGKPNGIPVELADFVIRLADFSGFKNWKLNDKIKTIQFNSDYGDMSIDEMLLKVISIVCQINTADNKDTLAARAYDIVENYCRVNGINLQETLNIKTRYNESRAYRHGGKKA